MCLVDVGSMWRAMSIYGWPESSNKHKIWELLNNINHQNESWLCFGDLNEIMFEAEKSGEGMQLAKYEDFLGYVELLQPYKFRI